MADDEKPKAMTKNVDSNGVTTLVDAKGFSYIPETVLKKRKTDQEWAIRKRYQLEDRIRRSKEDKGFKFVTASQLILEHRLKEMDLIHMKRRGKKRKRAFTPSEKLLFIIRTRGKNDIHPKTRNILKKLRLWKINTGVFMKASATVLGMLQLVEPHVTYGYPNLKNVKELIYKKGLAKLDKQMVPLTDNNLIEQELGKYGILCIEDIVHEIANVGPHFIEVTNCLYPFKLNKPEEGLQGLKTVFKEGGESGNREDLINDLISKMN